MNEPMPFLFEMSPFATSSEMACLTVRKGGFGGQPLADVISALTNHLLKPIADLEVSGDGAVEIDDLGHGFQ